MNTPLRGAESGGGWREGAVVGLVGVTVDEEAVERPLLLSKPPPVEVSGAGGGRSTHPPSPALKELHNGAWHGRGVWWGWPKRQKAGARVDTLAGSTTGKVEWGGA